jgi:uncharacterized protein YbjT (DUF2867 family)
VTLLVTGATGSVGRLVVDHLLARGATGVRALTVDPDRAALPDAVEVVSGSMSQALPLQAALRGVDRLYLAPDPVTVAETVSAARHAGVSHIVDLSGEPESWWGAVSTAVESSGVPWTHLWPGDFMENTLVWAAQIRTDGIVREPWPHAASTPIAMDDIAAVAATALLSADNESRAYSLTGPQALTRRDLAEQIGQALGRKVSLLQVTRDEAVAVLSASMGDNAAWYVDTVLAGSAAASRVEPNSLVESLIGRPATTFAEWAAQHADDFR